MNESTMDDEGRERFGAITRLLIFCAGADKRLLAGCPNSDLVKIQGIGGVVAATGLLAFLSGGYAFYTVFSPKESLIGGAQMVGGMDGGFAAVGALVFGLIWALVIFNLDRFIVAASGPGDGKDTIDRSEFKTALPRIVMAVLIGLVLAAPLEVRIMKTEIEAALSIEQSKTRKELNDMTDAKLKDDRQRLDAELARVRSAIADREKKVTELQQQLGKFTEDLNRELQDGGAGRGKGDGPVAAALRTNMRDVEGRLAQERAAVQPQIEGLQREAADVQRRIDDLQRKRDEEYAINTKNAQRNDGLMRRIALAHEVSPIASYLLKFLLIVIEVAPIIFKLMLIAGPYEYFTENEKRLAIARRAIDVAGAVKPGGAGKQGELLEVKSARYAEAEAVTAREVGKWRVEAHLTDAALAAHQRRLEADIDAHPERFVDQLPPSTKA